MSTASRRVTSLSLSSFLHTSPQTLISIFSFPQLLLSSFSAFLASPFLLRSSFPLPPSIYPTILWLTVTVSVTSTVTTATATTTPLFTSAFAFASTSISTPLPPSFSIHPTSSIILASIAPISTAPDVIV